MDGGEKQSEKARELAAIIKQRSASTASSSKGFAVHTFQVATAPNQPQAESAETRIDSEQTEKSSSAQYEEPNPTHSSSQAAETATFLTAFYWEAVFPVLFPWYCPSTLSGGRSWILSTLEANEGFRHAAITASGYYFTLVLARDAPETVQTPCGQHVWDTVARHRNQSLQVIQKSLRHGTNLHAVPTASLNFTQIASIVDTIAHVLVADASIADGQNVYSCWETGSVLLKEALQMYGCVDGNNFSLENILLALEKPPTFDNTGAVVRLRNASQTSFQFSLAVFLYADIILSTSRKQSPTLQKYHTMLAPRAVSSTLPRDESFLPMQDYVGCHGWALALVGQIATLHALDASEEYLAIRGQELQNTIFEGLESLGPVTEPPQLQSLVDQEEHHRLVTKMWLHAAWIYLSTVMHGWKPQRTDCSGSVSAVCLSSPTSSPDSLDAAAPSGHCAWPGVWPIPSRRSSTLGVFWMKWDPFQTLAQIGKF
ncbi:hypothetical protein NQ176_g7034 [Zarea fungicola]|uniref:Uncharacterized protein n=1 Tax=Zarea fungicola TaxID=93591 RepID=A0ACC1N080_9HYPO|nr:hypothetical protein NQ176_g7034 [Lecanicillium fungicola]